MEELDEQLLDQLRSAHLHLRLGSSTSPYWQNHFIGSALVSLAVDLFACERAAATSRMNDLLLKGLIHRVWAASGPFQDSNVYYRFESEDQMLEDGTLPDVLDVAALITDPKHGVKVKNRKYHLRSYPNCFVASKAVKWLLTHVGIASRELAVEMGQLLVDRCVIEHVVEAQPFRDKYLFFRLVKESPVLLQVREPSFSSMSRSSSVASVMSEMDAPVELPSSVDVARLMYDSVFGVEVKDRKFRLKTYKRCFVASDGVTWMVNTLGLGTRARAEEMGQKLVDSKLIEHVVVPQPFQDKFLFFKFSPLLDSQSCARVERVATLNGIHDLAGYPSSSPSPPSLAPMTAPAGQNSNDLSSDGSADELSSHSHPLGSRFARHSADSAVQMIQAFEQAPSLSIEQQADQLVRELIELEESVPASTFEVIHRSLPGLQQKLLARAQPSSAYKLSITQKAYYRRSRSPSMKHKRSSLTLAASMGNPQLRSRSASGEGQRSATYSARVRSTDSSELPSVVSVADLSSVDPPSAVMQRNLSTSEMCFPDMPVIPGSPAATPRLDSPLSSDTECSSEVSREGRSASAIGSSEDQTSKRRHKHKRPSREASESCEHPRCISRTRRKKSIRKESPRISSYSSLDASPKQSVLSAGTRRTSLKPTETSRAPQRRASTEAVLSPRSSLLPKQAHRSASACSLASDEESQPLSDNEWALIVAVYSHFAALSLLPAAKAQLGALNLSKLLCAWIRIRPTTALVKWILDFLQEWEATAFVAQTNSIKLQLIRSRPPSIIRTLYKQRKATERKRKATQGKVSAATKVRSLFSAEAQLLGIDVSSIAEHITLKESGLFSQIRMTDLLGKAWEKLEKNDTNNVKSLVNRFNRMSHWAALSICTQADLEERIDVLGGFIALALELAEIHNFNACMAIVSGLNNSSVQRLRKTWRGLNERHSNGWEELTVLVDTKNNYATYRAELSSSPNPVVPFLGVILRDITFILDGNPCLVGDGYINMSKLLLLGDVLAGMRLHQLHRFVPQSNRFVPTLLLTIEHSWLLPLESSDVAEDTLYAISKSSE